MQEVHSIEFVEAIHGYREQEDIKELLKSCKKQRLPPLENQTAIMDTLEQNVVRVIDDILFDLWIVKAFYEGLQRFFLSEKPRIFVHQIHGHPRLSIKRVDIEKWKFDSQ
jgi:hypothetical protein